MSKCTCHSHKTSHTNAHGNHRSSNIKSCQIACRSHCIINPTSRYVYYTIYLLSIPTSSATYSVCSSRFSLSSPSSPHLLPLPFLLSLNTLFYVTPHSPITTLHSFNHLPTPPTNISLQSAIYIISTKPSEDGCHMRDMLS